MAGRFGLSFGTSEISFPVSLPYMHAREVAYVTNEGAPRLDISSLVPTVHKLFSADIPKSTQRTYKSGMWILQ